MLRMSRIQQHHSHQNRGTHGEHTSGVAARMLLQPSKCGGPGEAADVSERIDDRNHARDSCGSLAERDLRQNGGVAASSPAPPSPKATITTTRASVPAVMWLESDVAA